MQDLPDKDLCAWRCQFGTFPCERADPDKPFGFQNIQDAPQVFLANYGEPGTFGFRQLVRRQVAPCS